MGEASRKRRAALAALREADEVNAAQAVAAEMMSATATVRALSPEEIERRELDAVLRELEREEHQQCQQYVWKNKQRQLEAERQAEAAHRAAQARADAQRQARERLAQADRERQARADRERLARLEQWATAREAADWRRQQEGAVAAHQQRLVTAYQNVVTTMEQILRPAELPPESMQRDEGSPDLGPDFNPDGTIARFTPWEP
jgi:hypothetical protein